MHMSSFPAFTVTYKEETQTSPMWEDATVSHRKMQWKCERRETLLP